MQFQKIVITTPRKVNRNAWGFKRPNFFKGKYDAKIEFPAGMGGGGGGWGFKLKCWRGMDVFWNNTVISQLDYELSVFLVVTGFPNSLFHCYFCALSVA